MRPKPLFPLFAPVDSLPGVGAKIARLIEKLAGGRVVDLLWHFPNAVVDRRAAPPLGEVVSGQVVTLRLRVEGHIPPASPRGPTRVRCVPADGTAGTIDLAYFRAGGDWLAKTFPVGEERLVSGRVDWFNDLLQMPHPDRVGLPEEWDEIAIVEPVYPLTAGLAPKLLHKAVQAALARAPELPEWQDPAWLSARGWPGWREALTALHAPADDGDLSALAAPRQRLAFDEMLANQLALALIRRAMKRRPGRALVGNSRLAAKVEAALPYRLTGAQRQSLAEIAGDMADSTRMLRLLQGDVGSGKTVVALLAMLIAVEAGAQAALLAPTEILARQHHDGLAPLVEAAGLRLALLTGRDKGRARAALLDQVAAGDIHILVGTHALLQEDVAFRDLGLAVIDEQHRFGVHQRLSLSDKGRGTDVLVMTATPIPRTLQLTAYGDMDVSRLWEKPPGRQPVDTRTVPLERLEEVIAGVKRRLDQGAKVYWVCPLVEESETGELAAATARHADLAGRFGPRVGLVHGRLKATAKDAVMAAFADPRGGVDLLVATTVIEVGVNVPEATVMVIEQAERFGLAQLHQLRGRIGRGSGASTCLLLYGQPLGATAKARLRTLRETEDGFRIAEEDLRLRGAGEVLGTRQSGLPEFRCADLAVHGDLLAAATDDAKLMLERDPDLKGERGTALRTLLYLFERDAAVKYLRSG